LQHAIETSPHRPTAPYGSSNGVEGSGATAIELREVARFASADLAGSNHVSITVGPEQSVRVQADDNLIHLITTDVRAGQLVIDNHGSFQTNSPLSVDVTLPALDAVSLSGSGALTAQAVRAGTLAVGLPGSGRIRASGAADRLLATVDGSGELQLDDLIATEATAVVSGSGLVRLLVSEGLGAWVSAAARSSTAATRARSPRASQEQEPSSNRRRLTRERIHP
jgi:hypothetical protein